MTKGFPSRMSRIHSRKHHLAKTLLTDPGFWIIATSRNFWIDWEEVQATVRKKSWSGSDGAIGDDDGTGRRICRPLWRQALPVFGLL